ncbi:MAG: hypothetical protein H3C32_04610 [Anaerolineae bacterium]|nr:MAG: dimethylargininase [Chloroflexi bacterium OLB13]MBW7878572.1 hypothetical protein [Anaerolineae bacterium]MEB2364860.1 arginine deiminase family protein [Chloroflexota bacterium]OQY79280.1 MAG: hypothetical protein B6D42_15480 [Anaerolineae bacterium UTCFX5]
MSLLPPMSRVLARKPARTFADGITTRGHLGIPTYEATIRQFDAYLDAIRSRGLAITTLAADDRYPDGHYTEDTAVLFGDTAFICRPALANRRGEEAAVAEALAGLNIIRAVGDDVAIEGGDVLFCADRVLIGLSRRTNRAGADQLAAAIRSTLGPVRIDYVPVENVLHLKTGLTELAPGILLHDPAMKLSEPIPSVQIVTLPPDEGYAASVLPIDDETILIAKGYPAVQALAEQHYANVIALEMSEFEKMDGGLTCLSLRY